MSVDEIFNIFEKAIQRADMLEYLNSLKLKKKADEKDLMYFRKCIKTYNAGLDANIVGKH